MALLDEPLAISTEFGMKPLMGRVLSRTGDIEGLAPGPYQGLKPFSAR
jgi:hypothetical protein